MSDRSVSVWLKANVDGYLASIKKAQLTTSDFAKTAQRDAKAHSAAYDKVGKSMLITGGVIAAGLGLAIKASMEFRAQMAQVQSLSGATASQMKQLSDAALTVGQRFGFTAKQVADAETELVKAGLSVKDILGGALTGALTLAADGQMNVADATQIAVSAMTQFKLSGKDVPHIADLLAAGADKALGSVGDLGSALSSSGTVAHQFGWNLQETVGTLSEFAQNAQIGEKGGTLLRQMLLQLVNPSQQASAIMDKYGLSITDANGAMVGSAELAGRLQKSFGGLTPAVRNHALAVIFGAHAIQGANILMTDGAKVNAGWVSSVNDAGFAAKQAAGKMDSLSGDLSKLKASFETGLIKTGDQATGTLRGMVQVLTDLTGWYDNMGDGTRAVVTDLALVTGAVTLATGAVLVGLPKYVAFTTALATLRGTAASTAATLDGLAASEAAAGAGGGIGAGGEARGVGGKIVRGVGSVAVPLAVGWSALDAFQANTKAGNTKQAMSWSPAQLAQQKTRLAGLQSQLHSTAPSPATARIAQQVQTLTGQIQQATAAQKANAVSAAATAVATAKVGAAASGAAMSVQDYSDALKAANQPALDARSAARDYQAAIDGVTDSMKQNGHSLDSGTAKGRANQAALDAVAAAANNAAAANRANGQSLPKINAQLEVARGQLYDMARKFGLGKDAAHAYVNTVLGIPGKANTQVTLAGIKAAKQAAKDLKTWLHNELGVINIQARVRNSVGKGTPVGDTGIHPATGGHITGPGTGTSDSIKAWLSNGEYVINAASAARIGIDNLHALNHFASGGSVGRVNPGQMMPWSMPDRIVLEVDGHQFTAYVRGHAASVAQQAMYTEARAKAGRPR